MHLLFHSFCDSGIQVWLSWVPLAHRGLTEVPQGSHSSHRAATKMAAGAMVLSEGLNGEDPLPSSLAVGRIQSLTGYWSEAASFSSLPCGPLHRAGHNMEMALLRASKRGRVRRYLKWKSLTFCNLILEGISHKLCHILFVFPSLRLFFFF